MTAVAVASIGVRASNRRPPAVRSSSTSGTITATTTAGSVSKPAGARIGDIILVAAQLGSTADTLATPVGWTLLFGPVSTSGAGTNTSAYLFSRPVDGSEAASLAFTKTGTAASWRLTAVCVSDTAGVGATASRVVLPAGTTDLTPVLETITPTVDKSLVLGVVVVRNTTTVTVPARYVDVVQSVGGSFNIDFCRRGPVDSGGALVTANCAVGLTSKWVTFTVEMKHT